MCITPEVPNSAVGITGGDVWSGVRVNTTELESVVEEATSVRVRDPIIPQYYPARTWLWRQWGGTIVRRVVPSDVLINIIFAVLVVTIFRQPTLKMMVGDLASVQKT